MDKITVYVPVTEDESLHTLYGSLDSGAMVSKKENVYVLDREQMQELIKKNIWYGVGTYEKQLAGGEPTNSTIEYYISELLDKK